MSRQLKRRISGFTLLEVLVALAIVAISLSAVLRAATQGVSSTEGLRQRLVAGWVAENRLAEHRARRDWLPPGRTEGTIDMAGERLIWRETVATTPNNQFRRLDIDIREAGAEDSHHLAQLTGFLVKPGG